MIDVENKLKVYELNDEECDDKNIIISSHRNNSRLVNIIILRKKYTVAVSDLEAAIKNASNTAKY